MPRHRKASQEETALRVWRVGAYARLSREDGDKPESDSIAHQRMLLEDYIAARPELTLTQVYTDDGCTGTNFDRPAFRQMLADLASGRIDCVLVKDLSRFGRDYIGMGHYLERWLPEHGARFIAINDGIDSQKGPYDMLLPVKNVFNEQYARDISRKVKSALRVKRQRGEFVGAFACFGYEKDPERPGRLRVDPAAAPVVRRIFELFEAGTGKVRIARILNQEGLPCPSAYKQLQGQRYHNGLRLDATAYWTYATIHRMLSNRMYAGSMEQGRTQRQTLHGRARQLERSQWTVVEGTHEAIVSPAQFERVQVLLEQDTRSPCFDRSVSPFAGFLRCGDCGRAMSKTGRTGAVRYCCGSYKRYGPSACSGHSISQRELEELLLSDLNRMLAAAGDLSQLAARALPKDKAAAEDIRQQGHLRSGLERTCRLKKAVYEDYREGLLTREEFLKYREDYQRQETQLAACLARLETREPPAPGHPWAEALVKEGRLAALDRATLAEAVEKILVFADGTVEITYKFAPCAALAPEEALSES